MANNILSNRIKGGGNKKDLDLTDQYIDTSKKTHKVENINHAFLIQCHTAPQLVNLFIERLKAPNHFFFIHVDKKTVNYEDFLKLKSSHVFFTPKRYKVNWAAEEQIYLTLELIKLAYQHDMPFEYFHLVSGQDLPIVSNDAFDTFFDEAAKQGSSFMECCDNNTEIENRFMLFHFNKIFDVRNSNIGGLFNWKIVDWQQKLSRHFSLRPKLSMPFFKGCNWWSLNRKATDYVIEYCRQHPKYVRRFRFTSCCDEVFFHTILFNSPLRSSIVMDDLRYIDWTPGYQGEPLPRLLKECDYSKIINSNKLFMRKIDLIQSASLIEKMYR